MSSLSERSNSPRQPAEPRRRTPSWIVLAIWSAIWAIGLLELACVAYALHGVFG